MALLVIAVPEISEQDYNKIQAYRAKHDGLFYTVVEPHFTLVFPVFDIATETFTQEVASIARGFIPFEFKIRCSTINKDAFNDYYHVFLVPDEGYSHLVKLHDRLYEGAFSENLRLDIDFIPHIGIGNSLNPKACQEMAGHWNRTDFCISGNISSLQVVEYDFDSEQLSHVATFALGNI
ncbi:2'-5' RNA ligase family protein [Photobacterium sp. 53610]|uniref:2'-5' RNA ligase family protein n=1 Tax=Photobacterium sp. 53610 TaxID=3102789 RepID=UPI002EDB8596